MSSPGTELSLISRARRHGHRTAVTAPEGRFTYDDLLDASEAVARALLGDRPDLLEMRVAFLAPPGFAWVAVQWGIWRAGGIAVPLAVSHPPPELAYVLRDAAAAMAVVHPALRDRLAPAALESGVPLLTTDELIHGEVPAAPPGPLPPMPADRRALMLYTSGTTGRPKGVVTTHANIEAQVTALVTAWGWSADDRILLVLPLHHVHGIVNVVTCSLWSGAHCRILPRFDPEETWEAIAAPTTAPPAGSPTDADAPLTLFMAVPTVYARLLAAWEAADPGTRARRTEGCRAMRIMVSGSAALPVPMLERWRDVSGHTLLERYGMTEIGMALSNPLEGERRPGFVGRPLPEVEVRLADEDGEDAPPGTPGEILVRGPAVFREYWRRPDETSRAFRDGWFVTGDIAVLEDGAYRILGRRSVDIIKTGGYKVSALEVEEVLRTHPLVSDCAVVALPDPEWGERVAAAIVPEGPAGMELDPAALRTWAKEHMAPYKAPSVFLTLPELPRNAMGKVTKPAVKALFSPPGSA